MTATSWLQPYGPEHRRSSPSTSGTSRPRAAQYLCTTPGHVRELWAKRCLAPIKVGRSVRFSKVDLDAYIAARRVEAVRRLRPTSRKLASAATDVRPLRCAANLSR